MFQLPSRSRKTGRSRKRKPPRNYFSRREQIRLMVLVGMVMLVIVLMYEARKPENWYWLWDGAPASENAVDLTQAEISDRHIDTRVKPKPPSDELDVPGSFYSPAPEEEPEKPEDESAEGFFPGVKPSLLKVVEDDTVLLPYAEQDAWYHLLAVLARDDVKENELRKARIGRVGFLQLYEQPKAYRGRLVTIRGTIRRAVRVDAGKNDWGIEGQYWRCVDPAWRSAAVSGLSSRRAVFVDV